MPSNIENACKNAIVEAAGGEITPDQAAQLLQDYVQKAKLVEMGQNMNADLLRAGADEAARTKIFAALLEQRNKVINTVKNRLLTEGITNNFGGDFLEGMVAALGGYTQKLFGKKMNPFGGKQSVQAKYVGLQKAYLGTLKSQLESKGLLDVWAKDELEVETAEALAALSNPRGNIKDLKVDQRAKDIAEIMHNLSKQFVERVNRAGANIGTLEDFIAQQVHNPNELRRAGTKFRGLNPKTWGEKVRVPDEVHQMAWVNEMKSRLDIKRSFPDLDDAGITAKLKEDWRSFVTGAHYSAKGAEDYAGFSGFDNVAKRMSGQRTYHFKTPKDFVEYNKQFGTGSLKYSFVGRIDSMARNISLMEVFGTNPGAMLDNLHKRFIDKAKAMNTPEGNAQVEKLQNKRDFLFNVLKTVDGSINIATSPSQAKWINYAANIRKAVTMSKLGGVMFRSLPDHATTASKLRMQGIDISKSYLETMSHAFQTPSGSRKEVGHKLGLGMEGFMGYLNQGIINDGAGPGTGSKIMDTYFRLGLLQRHDNAIQSSVAWLVSGNLGDSAGKTFDSIDAGLRSEMEFYGIDAKHWDLVRETKWDTDSGHSVITPDKVYNIDKAKIEAAIRAEGRTPTADNVGRYYDDLHSRFSSFVVDTAETAIPKPGARQMALLNQGHAAGTPTGMAIRFITQFKPFLVSMFQKGIAPTMRSGDAGNIVNWIVGTTVMGWAGQQAINMAAGKKPQGLHEEGVLLESLLKGGSGSIYADFLLGNYDKNKNPALNAVIGPTFGQFNDVMDVFTKFKEMDEDSDPWAELAGLGQRNMPLQNLFWLKHTLDRAIFWRAKEFLNPGSLDRMQRAAEERGVEFQDNAVFKPPTSSE